MNLITNNKMTAKRAFDLGLPIKKSKRFLRVKKSILAVLSNRKNIKVIGNIIKVVERSHFEVDFQCFNDVYVLSSDGVKYIDFDILIGESVGIGMIDHRECISKVISMQAPSHKKIAYLFKVINLMNNLNDTENSNLGYTVLHSVALDFKREGLEYALFENFKKKNPFDLEFIDGKKNRHNIPDAWVLIDGEECPVEAKKDEFDFNALQQLRRYMNEFGAKKGVAVANSLKTTLPDDVIFYDIKG